MWSNGFPTKISAKRNRRDRVVWKEMCKKRLYKALRRFYAPKCRALPTGLHPDFIKFFSKWSNMWSNGFPTEISAKQKHRGGVVWKGICGKRLCEALWRFCAPKCRALPTGLHPDFYEFFSKWSNLWSNGFPTEISAKQKHRDDVVWKGMCNKPLCKALRRFYAPKWSAIPIPPRPMFTKILYNKNRDLSSTER